MNAPNILTVQTLNDAFENCDAESIIDSFKKLKADLLKSGLSEEEFENVVEQLEIGNLCDVADAFPNFDLVNMGDFDLSDHINSGKDIENLYELVGVFYKLKNETTGLDIFNLDFIESNHFEDYAVNLLVEYGDIKESVKDLIDKTLASERIRIDYGTVALHAENTLGLFGHDYFYSKC